MPSEVAQLLAQIDAAHHAAMQGLYGLAQGTARHDFITAKMEQMQRASEQLIETLGVEKAMPLIIKMMEDEQSF